MYSDHLTSAPNWCDEESATINLTWTSQNPKGVLGVGLTLLACANLVSFSFLGERQVAWKYLREALIESVTIGAVPLNLETLVGVAHQLHKALPVKELEAAIERGKMLEPDTAVTELDAMIAEILESR